MARNKNRDRHNSKAPPAVTMLLYISAFNLVEEYRTAGRSGALVIETPEPATIGTIRVFDYDGCCIYAYYGKIKINNDGTDGKEIDVICEGYLEGYEQHKEPGYTGESEEKGNE